jgi:outer membrane protein assembly factor BamB
VDLKRAVTFGATNKDRDVTPVNNDFDPNSRANERSALAWHYGGEERHRWAYRDFKFGRTMSTACVVDGIVYVPELAGYVHCLNARTGEHYWAHDTKSAVWSSAYYVDGKVLVATEAGDLFVYRHDPKPERIGELDFTAETQKEAKLALKAKRRLVEQKYLKWHMEFDSVIRGTPSVADGVLYLATEKTLYAIDGYPRP